MEIKLISKDVVNKFWWISQVSQQRNFLLYAFGTKGNPNADGRDKDVIYLTWRKAWTKMHLQNWLIQQLKLSWLNLWGFGFFLSFSSTIFDLFSACLPQSPQMGSAVPGGGSRNVHIQRERWFLPMVLSQLPCKGNGVSWLALTNQTYRRPGTGSLPVNNGSRVMAAASWLTWLCTFY